MAIPGVPKEEAIKIEEELVKEAPQPGDKKTKEKNPKAERENLINTRLYLSKEIKQRVAMAAVKLERFQYDIIAEAIEEWLDKRGL